MLFASVSLDALFLNPHTILADKLYVMSAGWTFDDGLYSHPAHMMGTTADSGDAAVHIGNVQQLPLSLVKTHLWARQIFFSKVKGSHALQQLMLLKDICLAHKWVFH